MDGVIGKGSASPCAGAVLKSVSDYEQNFHIYADAGIDADANNAATDECAVTSYGSG